MIKYCGGKLDFSSKGISYFLPNKKEKISRKGLLDFR